MYVNKSQKFCLFIPVPKIKEINLTLSKDVSRKMEWPYVLGHHVSL